MSGSAWFLAVEIVHALPQRVRFRLTLRKDAPLDARALQLAALQMTGVTGARINRRARALILTHDRGPVHAEALRRAVAQLPAPGAQGKGKGGSELCDGVRAFGQELATLVATPSLPMPLRLPVSATAALPLYRNAIEDFRNEGKITSHVLEAIAVSISLARADYTAANTTTFMLALGDYFETAIARRSEDLLRTLLRPSSDLVWVLKEGEEVQVPADTVEVGDTVIVATGAVIPIDGTVLQGEATVNEAAMTGEAVSAAKSRGSQVLSGTLVEDGRLAIYAEHVGVHTAAARIADYVEQSLVAKSEAQLDAMRLADRLVPTVLKLAGGAYLLTGDWRRAASVLQGDYSCALKLATPVAFKATMYHAGQSGILIKGATALEKLAQADTFIFDKTGTLTTGTLEVTDVVTFDDNFSAEDLICLAASVEEHYFHPMAMAVVAAARATNNRHFDHQEVQFIVAHGVASVVDGKRVVVGSRHFIQEDEGIDISAHQDAFDRLYQDGKTLLFIGFDGALLGILALKDQIRDNAFETVKRLRALGAKSVLLLTGDHRQRGAELGAALGLDGVHAELLPEDKARIVEELAQKGARIAFIGDGINDAPALAGAHVGIAMHKGADIARLTADIALLEDDVERVADAKAMANAAMAMIERNYRLTVGLNTAILLGAALGLFSPVTTAVLHNGTTLGILLNALRQGRKRGRRAGRKKSAV